jgi:hypothetical protein
LDDAAFRILRRSNDRRSPLAPPFWTAAFAHRGTIALSDFADVAGVKTNEGANVLDFLSTLIEADYVRCSLEVVELIEQSRLCHFTLRQTAKTKKNARPEPNRHSVSRV